MTKRSLEATGEAVPEEIPDFPEIEVLTQDNPEAISLAAWAVVMIAIIAGAILIGLACKP